eukprot:1677626-Prymnesium_polylepis.1
MSSPKQPCSCSSFFNVGTQRFSRGKWAVSGGHAPSVPPRPSSKYSSLPRPSRSVPTYRAYVRFNHAATHGPQYHGLND